MFDLEGYFAEQHANRKQWDTYSKSDLSNLKQQAETKEEQVKMTKLAAGYQKRINKADGQIHAVRRGIQTDAAKALLGTDKTDKKYLAQLKELGADHAETIADTARTDRLGMNDIQSLQAKQTEYASYAQGGGQNQSFFARLLGG